MTIRASDGTLTADAAVSVAITDVPEQTIVVPADPEILQTVSELAGEDFSTNISTAGRIVVDDTATGNIGTRSDRDWFAVELVADREYQIDLRGSPTGDGTLSDPYLRGIHDAEGTLISGTTNDDGGAGYNSRVTFTASETGTYYIAAGAFGRLGTYELEVRDVSPQTAQQETVNDPPVFDYQGYAFTLAENADGGTNGVSLGTVTASDPDDDPVAYSIEGGNAPGLFEIDAQTGELFYVGAGEDYEAGAAQFDMTIRASDGTLTADAAVSVAITDVPEQTIVVPADPEILQTVSELAGEDFSTNISTAGRIVVDDTATGNIGTRSDRDWFAVELVADREYQIDLRGSPTGDGTLSDPYLRGIHDAEGTLISGTTNDDGGAGYNSRVTFTASETGTYYIAAGAFGRLGTYELEVRDVSPQTAQQETVNGPPAFGQVSYEFSLAENADGGVNRVSLGTVTASDPDDDPVAYSIKGGNAPGLFEIDAQTGELFYVGAGEDYEAGAAQFDMTIRASDGTLTADAAVSVAITDVPEQTIVVPADPEILQSVSEPWSEDLPTDTSTIGRVAVGGTAYGTIRISGDRDGFAVELVAGRTYIVDLRGRETSDGNLRDPYLRGIMSPDGSQIAGVSDDDGGVGRNSRLSFTPTESGTHYIIAGADSGVGTYEVQVRDTSPQTAQQETANGPPAFGQASYEFTLAENTDGGANRVSLGTVTASDPDDDPVVYSIEGGNESGSFEIHAASGELFYVGPGEDYEAGAAQFDLTIRASDGILTTDAAVSVAIADPEHLQSGSEPRGEDIPPNTSTSGWVAVGGTATGNIGSVSQSVGQSYGDTHDQDWFAVELVAGRTYIVDLRGSETGDGTLGDPWLQAIARPDGSTIWGISDDDGGEGKNSRSNFTPTESGTHYIGVAGRPGAGRMGTYEIEVRDTSPQTAQQETVNGAPAFGQASYEFTLAENTDGGANRVSLGTVTATDPDNDAVAYIIRGGNALGLFEIDAQTGELFYVGPGEDYEAGGVQFDLEIRASDGTLTADAAVSVAITDVPEQTIVVPADSVSEPSGGDLPSNTSTIGRVAVDGTATGKIDRSGDRDWFAVELVAGGIYTFDLRGSETSDGTLNDPYLRGIHDAEGTLISGTADNDGGEGNNSRVTFTASETGTYYIAAGAYSGRGTYELGVSLDQYGDDVDTAGTVHVGGTATGRIQYEGDRDWFAVTLEAGKTYLFDMEMDSESLAYLLAAHSRAGVYVSAIHNSDGTLNPGTFDRINSPLRHSQLAFTPEADGTYYVEATSNGNWSGGYTFRTTEIQDDFTASTERTGTVVVGGSAIGELEFVDDRDWFAVEVEAGKTYQIDVHGAANDGGTLRYTNLYGVYTENGVGPLYVA